jgi:hypothetical protein
MWIGRSNRTILAACAFLLAASCSSNVDLKQHVQVTDVSTGWYDAGVVDGKNKLVPSLTFKLRRPPDVKVPAVSLNLVFKAADGREHDDVFVQRVTFNDNGETDPITVRSQTGYTGDPPQSRAEMLKNAHFVDMDVEIFARQTSAQWIPLHKVRLSRQLLTD